MVLANLAIIAILVIVGILNNRGGDPPTTNPLGMKKPSGGEDLPIRNPPAMKKPPDWAKAAKSIDQLYQFNKNFPYVSIKHENAIAEAEQLGFFRLEKYDWADSFPNSTWCARVPLDLPSSIEAQWADSYVGIDCHRYNGGYEQFLSDVDSSVSIRIRKLPDGSIFSYVRGYPDVSNAYSLAEIRAQVNPLLRQMGSHCRITEDGYLCDANK